MARKRTQPAQPRMWQTEDLPLFSGTPTSAVDVAYQPEHRPEERQAELPAPIVPVTSWCGFPLDGDGMPVVAPADAIAACHLAGSLGSKIANAWYEASRQPARAAEFTAVADQSIALRASLWRQLAALGYHVP